MRVAVGRRSTCVLKEALLNKGPLGFSIFANFIMSRPSKTLHTFGDKMITKLIFNPDELFEVIPNVFYVYQRELLGELRLNYLTKNSLPKSVRIN